MNNHVLEPAAQEIADATSKPPFLYEIGVDEIEQTIHVLRKALTPER